MLAQRDGHYAPLLVVIQVQTLQTSRDQVEIRLSPTQPHITLEPRKNAQLVRAALPRRQEQFERQRRKLTHTVKIVVFAPIPKARVRIATAANGGFLASARIA
jgi:hypothetical protein